jgi:NYN domain/OST-HTH/LOTUS domain
MRETVKTTALFIDADNVRLTAIPQILEILTLEWTPIKMRAYGTQIGPRQKILRDHGVLPVEVIPVLPGKNSVDLVLTIDALEELFCGYADSIAIASGDSDFTPLALKIREHGRPILIFGHSFTPPALRTAATSFHCVGWFQQEPGRQGPQADSPESSVHREWSLDKRELLRSRMMELIREIVETDGEVTIGKLGTIINVRDPIFSPKRYGSGSLSGLLKQLGGFTLTPVEGEDGSVLDYEVLLSEH